MRLIGLTVKRILEISFLFYFSLLFFYLKELPFPLVFLLLPFLFLLFLFLVLKNKEEKQLLFQLYSLLLPLESNMKLGLSFINAWQKAVKDLDSERMRRKIQKLTEILQFQKSFCYPDKDVQHFIKDLMIICQSANPLKRLKNLQRKIRIEQTFYVKTRRALLQTRIQSGILTFFYLGLLIWTLTAYGRQYMSLVFISFLFFSVGLIWIFKTGRQMKWSV